MYSINLFVFMMTMHCVFSAVGTTLLTVLFSLVSIGKPERIRLPGNPRFRWGDNISLDLKDIGFGRGLALSGSG